MDGRWSMRAYREGDEEAILGLFRAVSPEKRYDHTEWMRWWRWMYKDNPAGSGRIWLAEYNNKIVGHYAIVPVRLAIAGKTVLASQAMDALTHPDYRRQRIFESLASKVFSEAAKDGIHIVYGFPNQFSYPGHINKLDWFNIANMQLMLKPLNWKNAISVMTKNTALGAILSPLATLLCNKAFLMRNKVNAVEGLTVNEIASFDQRFDMLWPRVANQFQIMVERKSDYLKWRYGAPETNYSIFIAEKHSEIWGYLVSKHLVVDGIKVNLVFDMLARSEEVLHCLIAKAIRDCQENGVALIQYQLAANEVYQRVLRRNGFISLPFSKGNHFCAYSSSTDISKQFLGNPRNWFVQIGDSDLI